MAATKRKQDMVSPTEKKKCVITRSDTDHFLIGHSSSSINGSKLPTTRQILKYILHLKSLLPVTEPIQHHLSQAIKRVVLFWKMAGLKTITDYNAEKKLEKIWNGWIKL